MQAKLSSPLRAQPLPPVAARLLARAQRELREGRGVDAQRTLASAQALAPGSPEVARWVGAAAQMRGDYPTAVSCFRLALPAWPQDPALHMGLGTALFECGEVEEALAHLGRACELAPRSAPAWFNLGEAMKRDARASQALDALQCALRLDATHISARLSLARVQTSLGRVAEAAVAFREVLRREPDNAAAWFGLSNLQTIAFSADDAARLQRAFARHELPVRSHVLLGFALAKALEDQGDHAHAFEALVRANAVERGRVKWNAAGAHKRVKAIRRVFGNWAPPVARDPGLGREAILLVSIPRSGSSLVEQILASHPEVEGANEIKDLPRVIDAETRRRQETFPLWVPMANAGDWQRLGEEYLARTARWRAHKPRFTDKNLVTWHLVGAGLAMLPAARVIIVRRDPLETCLACYRQWFAEDAGFAYDLDEMADYCIDFMRLTRFWLEKFPARVFDLKYETLVADPEPTIRRLLEFCGLPFHPACLEFHRTQRTVLSAPSAAQVRQPLRRDTARAHLYGDRLDHLRARLQDAGLMPESV